MKNCQECNKNKLKHCLWFAKANNLIKFYVIIIVVVVSNIDDRSSGGVGIVLCLLSSQIEWNILIFLNE